MTDPERGVVVVVWRRALRVEVLLLHRTGLEGEWAWTTPGGAREVDETAESAARRELREETGLDLECSAVASAVAIAQTDIDVEVFVAEASADGVVTLSDEHDLYEWVTVEDLRRCLPAWVAELYREVLHSVSDP